MTDIEQLKYNKSNFNSDFNENDIVLITLSQQIMNKSCVKYNCYQCLIDHSAFNLKLEQPSIASLQMVGENQEKTKKLLSRVTSEKKRGPCQRVQEVTQSIAITMRNLILSSNVREFSWRDNCLIIPPLTCVTSNNHSPLFLALGEREREGGNGTTFPALCEDNNSAINHLHH